MVLAYLLAPIPSIGLHGIWWAIPIGWVLADAVGFGFYRLREKKRLEQLEYASPAA